MLFGKKEDVVNLWMELQRLEWRTYIDKGAKGIFSISGHRIAEKLKKIVASHMSGKCLDVGCGCLSKPAYMADDIDWYGIDPLVGDKKRQFVFKKALAENLPFGNETFDGVLFATSLDHLINPSLGLSEAYRVLKSNGTIIIWYSRRGGAKYEKWLKRKGAIQFNAHHQWAFTDEIMAKMVRRAGFKIKGVTKLGIKNRILVGYR